MGELTDIWVCANCRSVNNLRARQCYQCRTPRDRAAVDPSTIDATTKGRLRDIELPEYLPSRPFALAASPLIVALGIVQGVNTLLSSEDVAATVDETGATLVDLGAIGPLGIATFVVAAAALVAFAAWLSRAVGAMPALGLGYPAATSVTAFLEVFIPGLNLMRIPAIIRDVIRRLEPQEGRGDVLIYAAWIGLFGGLILPRVGIYLGLFGADTVEEGARTLIVVRFLSTVLVVFGAVTLVALIWWIEGRIVHRRERQLAGEPAPATAPPAPGGAPGDLATGPGQPVISFRPAPPAVPDPEGAHPSPATFAPGHPLTVAPAPASPDPVATRSITAATRAGSQPPEGLPSPAGPHLLVELASDGRIVATIGDEEPETATLDEVLQAIPALAEATGRATVVSDPAEPAKEAARRLVEGLEDAGIPTTVRPPV